MSNEELLEIVKAGYEAGIRKVHWTGGEPLVRTSIVDVVRRSKEIGIQEQSMTTNGVLLPDLCLNLKEAGLDRVNISLDTPDPGRFSKITGRDYFDYVLEGLELASKLFQPLKLNVVVLRGYNYPDEIPNFVELGRMYNAAVRFIELMPYGPAFEGEDGGERFSRFYVSREEILNELRQLGSLRELDVNDVRGHNGVAVYYSIDGGSPPVGVIAPHSMGYACAGYRCRKIRVGPNGKVTWCVNEDSITLAGLSYTEKVEILAKLVERKNYCRQQGKYPQRHMPAYASLRFGRHE